MKRVSRGAVAAIAVLIALAAAPSRAAETLITLPSRPGVTQSFYVTDPAGPPVASLVLFPGGDGKLRGYGPADLKHGNFLVRSRDLFVAQGFAVAVIDAPSDQAGGLGDSFAASEAHRRDIALVIAWLRQHAAIPVWLVGTSRGTIGAAAGATLKEGGPDGLVLTSTVTRESRRNHSTVYDTAPNLVAVPTLLVHNRDDACAVCPFGDIADLLGRFASAPRKELIAFQGGDTPMSEPCEALSRHGYLGIEQPVVAAIAAWIKAK